MRCVLSDMGGVVMQIDFQRVLRHWGDACGRELDRATFPLDQAFEQFETGQMAAEEYFAHVGTCLDIELPHEQWVAGWNALFIGIDHDTLGLLGRVRGAVHRVVAVTNTNRTHEDHWRAAFPDFDAAFDHIYSSAQLGARKPDAAFFETVLEQEHVLPDQAFFIDDLAENVEGARAVGIPSHHFTGQSGLEEDLARHGFLPRGGRAFRG